MKLGLYRGVWGKSGSVDKTDKCIWLPFELCPCQHTIRSLYLTVFKTKIKTLHIILFDSLGLKYNNPTKSQVLVPYLGRYCQPLLSLWKKNQFLVIWLKIYLETKSIQLVRHDFYCCFETERGSLCSKLALTLLWRPGWLDLGTLLPQAPNC